MLAGDPLTDAEKDLYVRLISELRRLRGEYRLLEERYGPA